jgi:hypothetical protein
VPTWPEDIDKTVTILLQSGPVRAARHAPFQFSSSISDSILSVMVLPGHGIGTELSSGGHQLHWIAQQRVHGIVSRDQ